MKILFYEVGKNAKLIEIENENAPIQELVGGYYTTVPLDSSTNLILLCNEEGMCLELPYNRSVILRNDQCIQKEKIYGNFFICQFQGAELTSIDENLVEQVYNQCGK